MTRRCS
jgi:hypothetical protein